MIKWVGETLNADMFLEFVRAPTAAPRTVSLPSCWADVNGDAAVLIRSVHVLFMFCCDRFVGSTEIKNMTYHVA